MQRLRLLILATLCFLVVGCSSIPDFRPSKPPEEASTLNEALDICGSYEIKGEQNSMGRGKPVRVATMVPWINCFETTLRKFSEARYREDFVSFFRALQARHDGAQAGATSVDWPAMNFVVHLVMTHLKDTKLAYSAEEIRTIEYQLPGYAIYLVDSGISTKQFSDSGVKSQKLYDGAAETLQFGSVDVVSPPPLPLTADQREYCKNYRSLRSQLYNLDELAQYQKALQSQTYEDVSNTNEQAARERVNTRVTNLKKETDETTENLNKRLSLLQAKASWFKNEHCLQAPGRLKPVKK